MASATTPTTDASPTAGTSAPATDSPTASIFNATPPPEISVHPITFTADNLPAYASPPRYALTIDNAFTPAECAALLAAATASTSDVWEPAMINIGGGRQRRIPEVRDCGRIMLDDKALAGAMFDRVRPYMEEAFKIKGDRKSRWGWSGGHWRLTRLNERLRFLKYGPGHYFRPHRDGSYETPNGCERSFVTFQLYLSPESDANVGGTTRFWDKQLFLDVEPKQGRVLVFQHADLLHSGEEMVSGEKVTVRTDFMYERWSGEEEDDK
ncbi:hypothetical protein EDC01DRAFT_629719 [Geopyxis carbonaria]|nr:hypothetical protein EDC01DRAFT_629719 [Geopyxis carbonaria]